MMRSRTSRAKSTATAAEPGRSTSRGRTAKRHCTQYPRVRRPSGSGSVVDAEALGERLAEHVGSASADLNACVMS